MAKYRKKPVVVEAEQYTGPAFVERHDPDPPAPAGVTFKSFDITFQRYPMVVTAHGQETLVAPGDWIITEPGGRGFYPCKPDIFEKTYEPA